MRWSYALTFTLVLLFAHPALAQPTLRDVLEVGRILNHRSGSDVEQVLRVGGVLIQVRNRGTQRERRRMPRQRQRYPEVQYPRPRPRPRTQPQTYPAQRPQTQRQPQPRVVQGKPQGYDYIAVSGKTTRLDPTSLPLTINPGSSYHVQTVQKAVDIWNSAGMGTLFAVTNGPADITVDWTGSRVSAGARAETRMQTSSTMVVPSGISVKSQNRGRYELARVMTHELGHVLGLDHSTSRGDIMYRAETQGDLALSQRDVQMLRWLYAQPQYVPVVGATRTRGTVNSFALKPSSFCGCR
jgi:hypothetical protein